MSPCKSPSNSTWEPGGTRRFWTNGSNAVRGLPCQLRATSKNPGLGDSPTQAPNWLNGPLVAPAKYASRMADTDSNRGNGSKARGGKRPPRTRFLGKRAHASRQASKSGPVSADAIGNEPSSVPTAHTESISFKRSAPRRVT